MSMFSRAAATTKVTIKQPTAVEMIRSIVEWMQAVDIEERRRFLNFLQSVLPGGGQAHEPRH